MSSSEGWKLNKWKTSPKFTIIKKSNNKWTGWRNKVKIWAKTPVKIKADMLLPDEIWQTIKKSVDIPICALLTAKCMNSFIISTLQQLNDFKNSSIFPKGQMTFKTKLLGWLLRGLTTTFNPEVDQAKFYQYNWTFKHHHELETDTNDCEQPSN